MRARVKFINQPFFNFPPNKLICPGVLMGRADGRKMWSLVFTADKQINAVVYEGDLRWAVAPVEQDFGKGVRFQMISNPKAFADGPSVSGMFAEGELFG
jgi:hypothetical protein